MAEKKVIKRRNVFHRIVNVILGIIIAVLTILLIFAGFSQTETFREYLRKTVLSAVNETLNGEIHVEKIEGTLFTSVVLTKPYITLGNDTLLIADRISVKTSPLQILLKKIYVREVEIRNAKISLVRESDGSLNISRLVKPKEEIDTVKSKFPFSITLAKLNIINTRLRLTTEANRHSFSSYNSLNFDDLRIDSLNLQLNAYADIAENEYQLKIDDLRFRANLLKFRLEKITGDFDLNDQHAIINDFYLKTNSSDFNLAARLDETNFFEDFSYEKLQNSPVEVSLDARVFDFSDLTSFVSATDMMAGTLKAKLKVSGRYGDMNIDRLALDYLQTHLEAEGKVQNLHRPGELFINAKLDNSQINEPDIRKLLPGSAIPVYDGLLVRNIKAEFEGRPADFRMAFSSDLPEGHIESKGTLDFTGHTIKYDVQLATRELNLEPVIGTKTLLNTEAAFKGEGTSPEKMNATVFVKLMNSRYQDYYADSLAITALAKAGGIDFRMAALSQRTNALINGSVDLRTKDDERFNLTGRIASLNLENFLADTAMRTNINMAFTLNGRSFNFEKMESFLDVKLFNSAYKNIKIDTTWMRVDYARDEQGLRLIRMDSDFALLTMRGNYSLDEAIDLTSYQSKIISDLIMKKINEINPSGLINDSVKVKNVKIENRLANVRIPEVVNKNTNIDYDLRIKDFKLISKFAGVSHIDMDGGVYGFIENTPQGFTFRTNVDMKRLRILTSSNITYVSNLGMMLEARRANNSVSFDNLGINFRLNTDRVFSGTDLKNISASLNLENNTMDYAIGARMDTTLIASIKGNADMRQNNFRFAVDSFLVSYNDYTWVNDSALVATYDNNSFKIQQFSLVRNGSSININGSLYGDGKEDLRLEVRNLDAEIVNKLAGLSKDQIKARMNLSVMLNGYLHEPVIKLSLNVDSVLINGTNFGFLAGDLDYKDRLLSNNIVFVDSLYDTTKPLLVVKGDVPVDLAFVGAKDRLIPAKPINVSLVSDNFNLGMLSGFVPYTRGLTGRLIADMDVTGTTDDISYSGNVSLSGVSFLSLLNNMTYTVDLNSTLARDKIRVENFSISNAGGSNFKGTLKGSGDVNFKGTELQNVDMNISGDLAVLSEASRAVSPNFFGDVGIESDGNWRFTYDDGAANFDGNMLLKNTKLTIIPPQSAYNVDNEYNYIYPVDSTKLDAKQEEFKQVVSISRKYGQAKTAPGTQTSVSRSFRYDLGVEIGDEATITFVFDPVGNGRLVAVLDGKMIYESGGVAQGKFNLLEGSALQYIKTFDAEGSIYFESDPTNPRLDVIATYLGDHYLPEDSLKERPERVAVKIKLQGRVQELGKNLARNAEQSIAVYVGESNIENNTPDPQYDAADAMSFIIMGRFKDELTAGQKSAAASNASVAGYTTSILGGLVGSFANSQLGDIVKDFEVEQRGSSTRVSLSGRYQNFKYSLGGSEETLQDLSKANLSFEYPFTERFSFKFQRKDPVIETTNINEKINELSLRYKFNF